MLIAYYFFRYTSRNDWVVLTKPWFLIKIWCKRNFVMCCASNLKNWDKLYVIEAQRGRYQKGESNGILSIPAAVKVMRRFFFKHTYDRLTATKKTSIGDTQIK